MSTDLKLSRFVTVNATPWHSCPAYGPDCGVKDVTEKLTVGIDRFFNSAGRSVERIHGAPNSRNAVSVPRPTDTPPVCRISIPGYGTRFEIAGKFGDGGIHGSPVIQYISPRRQ